MALTNVSSQDNFSKNPVSMAFRYVDVLSILFQSLENLESLIAEAERKVEKQKEQLRKQRREELQQKRQYKAAWESDKRERHFEKPWEGDSEDWKSAKDRHRDKGDIGSGSSRHSGTRESPEDRRYSSGRRHRSRSPETGKGRERRRSRSPDRNVESRREKREQHKEVHRDSSRRSEPGRQESKLKSLSGRFKKPGEGTDSDYRPSHKRPLDDSKDREGDPVPNWKKKSFVATGEKLQCIDSPGDTRGRDDSMEMEVSSKRTRFMKPGEGREEPAGPSKGSQRRHRPAVTTTDKQESGKL